jgi:hypothetical protein
VQAQEREAQEAQRSHKAKPPDTPRAKPGRPEGGAKLVKLDAMQVLQKALRAESWLPGVEGVFPLTTSVNPPHPNSAKWRMARSNLSRPTMAS